MEMLESATEDVADNGLTNIGALAGAKLVIGPHLPYESVRIDHSAAQHVQIQPQVCPIWGCPLTLVTTRPRAVVSTMGRG